GSLFETTQLICDPGKGMFGEEGTHGCFDGVDRSNEEMSRTHREVRYTEVEEGQFGFRGRSLVDQRADAVEVVIDRRLQCPFEEVSDGKGRREVGAGGLAFPRCIVEIDLAGPD